MVVLPCVTRRWLVAHWRNACCFSSLANLTFQDDVVPLHALRFQGNDDSLDAKQNTHHIETALEALKERTKPSSVRTYIRISLQCRKAKNLAYANQLHMHICHHRLESHRDLGNYLVPMFVDCGSVTLALMVFDKLDFRKEHSWTSLIDGCIESGEPQQALDLFQKMQEDCVLPSKFTFTALLRACAQKKDLYRGTVLHARIVKRGLLPKSSYVANTLVSMYAKCGALAKARCVLQELPAQNVVAWCALIVGYTQQGQGQDALNCFKQMQHEGLSPNAVTFLCILKACGSMGAIDKGEHIHEEIAKQGLLRNNIVLGNALVDMYAKCGALRKAQRVLEELPTRNVVSWSALIAGYAKHGQGEDALDCFEQMQCEGLSPNVVTFICVLKACGSIGATEKGEQIHDKIARQGLLRNNVVLGTALVNMYAKCGAFRKAAQVLEELPVRDAVSWNALIAGYAQEGQGQDVLNCLEWMQRDGLSPNSVTFTCILKACGSIGVGDKGEQFHDEIARHGLLENNIVLATALVNMYAKCGAFMRAQKLLEEFPVGNVVSWSALIAAYAQQGQCLDALNCFEQMQHKGISPNAVTFSSVLNACSHAGLLEEGQMYFACMTTKYGIVPDFEHYTCMVDLFGRAGHFEKAVGIIQRMPSSEYPAVWSALLGACRTRGDVNVGRWAFENVIQVDKSDAPYLCMANIYVAAGMQVDAKKIDAMRVKLKHGRGLDALDASVV